jgi:hypothetical protein
MNMNSLTAKSVITTVTLVALAVAPLVRAADSERREQKTLPASSGGTLTLKAMVGAIDLKTHDKNEVTYDAVLKPVTRARASPPTSST